MPLASAFNTTSPASRPVHKVKVGIGGTACITDPGSVMTLSGAKFPATTGLSGVVSDLNTRLQSASVLPRGRLMGPTTSRALPVQSMIISLSVMVTATFSSTSSSNEMPSLSTKSFAAHVPLGNFARARRASRSPCSLMARIASVNAWAPYFSAISRVRRRPEIHADTCA